MEDKREQSVLSDTELHHHHHNCSYCDELTNSTIPQASSQPAVVTQTSDQDSLNLDLKIIIEKYGGLKALRSFENSPAGSDELSADLDDESMIAKSSIDLIQTELTDLGESLRKNEKDISTVDDGIRSLEKELKEMNARRAKCLAKNKKIRELIKLKAYLLCTAKKNGYHEEKDATTSTDDQSLCCSSFASSIGLLTSKNTQDQKKGIEQLKDKLCDNNCDRETLTKQAIEANVTRQLVGLLALDNLETNYVIDLLNILIQLASISCEARRSLTDACTPCIFDSLQALKKRYPMPRELDYPGFKGVNCKPNKVNAVLNEKADQLFKLIVSTEAN